MDRKYALAYSWKVRGWYAGHELNALWSMCCQSVRFHGILEVGCYFGRTSSLLAQFIQTLLAPPPLTFIDPFLPNYMKGFDTASAKAEFIRQLREIGAPYRLIEKRTIDILPEELPNSIDLLHVDGDHTETAVEIDCRTLLPLIRLGGIACFHDYGPGDFAVKSVVDRLGAGWKAIGTFGTVRALLRDQELPICLK